MDSEQTRWPGRWLSKAGIRVTERAMAGRLALLFAVTQAGHGLGATAADTLFFLRFGVDQLPLMILVSGPVIMVVVLTHSGALASTGARSWLWKAMLAAAVWMLILWSGTRLGTRWVYPVIWISTQAMIMLTFTTMWNAAGASCTTLQAKRLFPLFASAGVAGGVLGNLAAGPLTGAIGAENLLAVEAGLFLATTTVMIRSRPYLDSERPARQSMAAEVVETIKIIRKSRLLRIAVMTTVGLSTLFFLVVFPFNEMVANSFESEAAVASFLGTFASIATAGTFLFSLLATNRIFARFGIIIALMIVPAVYAVGFSTWLVGFGLAMAAAVRGLQWIAVNAIQGAALPALFNVVPGRRRGAVVAFITAVPAQVGTIIAGLILIVGAGWPAAIRFTLALGVSLLALAMVARMRPAYVQALVTAVRQGLVGVFAIAHEGPITPVDADAVRVLTEHLTDSRPGARAMALTALGRIGVEASSIEPLLADESPMVRIAAFDSMCVIEPDRLMSHVDSALGDEAPEVRLRAIHYLSSNDLPDFDRAATSLLDPDPRIKAAAAFHVGGSRGQATVAQLLNSGTTLEVTAVLDEAILHGDTLGAEIERFLNHPEPTIRARAHRAVAATGGDLYRLKTGLDDPSLTVRRAAASSIASSDEGQRIIHEVLAQGSVSATEAILESVVPIDDLNEEYATWASREAARAAFLESCRPAVLQIGSETADYLAKVLDRRRETILRWVLMAITTPATSEVMTTVESGIRSADIEVKAQAMEALDSIGARNVMRVVVPLLEDAHESAHLGSGQALDRLSVDFDPWIRALARRCLAIETKTDGDSRAVPSLTAMPVERIETMDEMGRILALQRVPMFSDLDPEDLALIAGVSVERWYEAGERIYTDGDAGDELLVIVEGEVSVTKEEQSSRRHVATYGPGAYVGELALLRGAPRVADVSASDTGLHALVLGKVDLASILEHRPAVATKMLATMAERMAAQT